MIRNQWIAFLVVFGIIYVVFTVYDLTYHPGWVAVDAGIFAIIALILLAMAASR